MIDDRVPTSDAGVGYPRAHALLGLLRQRGYPVALFPSYDATPYQPWLRDFQRAGVEVVCDGRSFDQFASERAGLYDVRAGQPAAQLPRGTRGGQRGPFRKRS